MTRDLTEKPVDSLICLLGLAVHKLCHLVLHSKKTTKWEGRGSKITDFETTQFMNDPLYVCLDFRTKMWI